MKVCVFGDDKDACIDIANQLNERGAAALIAKENEGLREVAGQIGRSFDRAVMVSAEPIKDSVIANRDPRVRAAICYNQKTLRTATSAGINLFILEQDAHERLAISDILEGTETRQQAPRKEKAVEPPRKEREREEKKQQRSSPPEPKAQPRSDGPKGEGVGGRLKDIFGIEE